MEVSHTHQTGLDIIGDVHGHADELRSLLDKLGYKNHSAEDQPVFRHPTDQQQAVFVGDLIDRGPKNLEAVRIVRGMVEVGSAHCILGNHEFNAVLYHTLDPDHPGEHLRPHTRKNQHQHQAFLDEMAASKEEAQRAIEWFRTLPICLEFPQCRIIHACWHQHSLDLVRAGLDERNAMSTDLWLRSARKGTAEYQAMETLLKGPELPLPEGVSFQDPDGHERCDIRLKWWQGGARAYREAAQVPPNHMKTIPQLALPFGVFGNYASGGENMTFIGHYWLNGTPGQLTKQVACVDYSVAKQGKLCAYRVNSSVSQDSWVCSSTL